MRPAGVMDGFELAAVPRRSLDRILALDAPARERAAIFAAACRINALFMVAWAGSGHLGSSFSAMDMVAWLHLHELRGPPGSAAGPGADVFFSSKGHDAPALYAVLVGLGVLEFESVFRLRRLGGLPGHPDVGTPGVAANTGSLGMGISKAKGMVLANRLRGVDARVYVMTGDGELQEGQVWESLALAAHRGMGELTAIVDRNRIQSDNWVHRTSDLGDLEAKFGAFGWRVFRAGGHDLADFASALDRARAVTDAPKAILADTVKGRGVSFMEDAGDPGRDVLYGYHSGAPTPEECRRALGELRAEADRRLAALGEPPLELQWVERPAPAAARPAASLVAAHGEELLRQAGLRDDVVVLDADLKRDCGLLGFEREHPGRFFECGIAEQDMVSMAGGMALAGLAPVVHSFACFLSARANEQIFNNATEGRKVVYVGSLAGLVPAGPGHSHQAVRDIAALGGIPGLTLVEPCCPEEARAALDLCLNRLEGSAYLRLVTPPCEIGFRLPAGWRLVPGEGTVLREGGAAAIVGYGPVLLEQACRAAERLEARDGIAVRVVDLPWLNIVDRGWLARALAGVATVVTLDNHQVEGGQGRMVAASLAAAGALPPGGVHHLGLSGLPACGRNDEVLRHHGLDAEGIERFVAACLRAAPGGDDAA